MVDKGERIWGRVGVLVFIMILVLVGAGGYFYYIKQKKPTQGIFVYDQKMRREELVSGHLYQSS